MDAVERMAPGSPPSAPRDRRREPLGQANAAEYGSLPRTHVLHKDTDGIENIVSVISYQLSCIAKFVSEIRLSRDNLGISKYESK